MSAREKWLQVLIYIGTFFILIIFFSLLYRRLTQTTYIGPTDGQSKENLDKDGIILLAEFVTNDDIIQIKELINENKIKDVQKYIISSPNVQNKTTGLLGGDYDFHDYIFLIKRSQFHTCHRDYNGDFFNENQQYPSYTIIIYLEDMEKCLDVIPKSHLVHQEYNMNVTDHTQTVFCKAGDAILFNANLIHNGSLNDNENNMRVQMKISHKTDHEVLHFYNKYHKVLNSENETPTVFKHAQKHISCQFPILGEYMKQYDNNKTSDLTPTNDPAARFFSSFFAKLETAE